MVLIQIFSGILDLKIMHDVTQTLLDQLPQATLIGTTTSGEIINGKMQDESIVISMSIFENTALKSIHLIGDDSETMGYKIGSSIVDQSTKCIIIFADGLKCNGAALLRGLNDICPKEIVIAGGMSGDNKNFEKSYCMHGNDIFEKGIVAVALSNPELEIFHTYNLSWNPIGRKMKVTKSVGNVLYELDNEPVKDVYSKYLGANVVESMPASTIEFPLIMHESGIDIARSMIALTDNGGIVYAGNMPEGSNVRFGVGSPNMLVDNSKITSKLAKESPIEGLFIYSCSARKAFLGKDLEAEFIPLSKIAPLAGFFTYGEFYHGTDHNEFLNITTTILGLSETKHIEYKNDTDEENFIHPSFTISALANLVEVTTQENEAYAKKLQFNIEQTQYYLDIAKVLIMALDNDKNIIMINQEGADILGYSKDEIIGKNFIENFIPESMRTETNFIADNILNKVVGAQNHIHAVVTKNGDERLISWKNSALYNKDGIGFGILTSGEDITEKVMMENQLQLQTKHEQMGEMLTMIAHQWRQPLSAISVIASSLRVQQDLETLSSEKLEKGLINIENYTQHLSETINDFRNFFKNDTTKTDIKLHQLVEDALKIISPIFSKCGTILNIEYLCEEEISTYPNEFKQVLLNIFKNAQDALEDKNIITPSITIKTYQENDKYCISIEDNAGGIPNTVIDKIFEPYFTTKKSLNGTGLGLYMSKIIIHEHCNGSIDVKNTDDGALFIIRLNK
ncbi:MAG: FIST N-terminal domain-containing protein [Sulfuricurvum sp.]|nr:FIST N-terminal domain-containing protein [Sulfuricurvum sp.]